MVKKCCYKIGDKFKSWFSDREDGMSTILAIEPYTGRYNFTYVLRLTAPRTYRGWMEMPVK